MRFRSAFVALLSLAICLTATPAFSKPMCMGKPVTGDAGDYYDRDSKRWIGSKRDDVFITTDGDDIIYGLAGSDRICAGEGDDKLFGGADPDVLAGEAGNDRISLDKDTGYGGPGDDIFAPLDVLAIIDGGASGDFGDMIDYRRLSDPIHIDLEKGETRSGKSGGFFSDIENVIGTKYADYMLGTPFGNSLFGAQGNDFLRGFDGDDSLYGGSGNDHLEGAAGNDIIDGGPNDEPNLKIDPYAPIDGTVGVTSASGDWAWNFLATESTQVDLDAGIAQGSDIGLDSLVGIENVKGGLGGNQIEGDGGENILIGGRQGDTIIGQGGADVVLGGLGGDVLFGDVPEGTPLVGDMGSDLIYGGDGPDRLEGGPLDDYFDGGEALDKITYYTASAGVIVSLASGSASGGAGDDTFVFIEEVDGSNFGDTLTGDDESNILNGGAGDDTIRGQGGDDYLDGGIGPDTGDGGPDLDVCEDFTTQTNCGSLGSPG